MLTDRRTDDELLLYRETTVLDDSGYTRSLAAAVSTLLLAGLGACDGSPTAFEDAPSLSLGFRAESGGGAGTSSQVSPRSPHVRPSIQVSGDNGTLTLDSVFLVVDEFKAEVEEGDCEQQAAAENCARFEAEPFFLDLPLDADGDGESETRFVAEIPVPPGTYTNFKFETRQPEDSLLAAIRDPEQHGLENWPGEASVLVVGDFEGEPFRAFFEAEVKVVLPIDPPLEVADEEDADGVTVVLNPGEWFTGDDGTVTDLTRLDFDPEAGGPVTKMEVKFLDGFTKIEVNE